jgi:hypothetical protein
VVDGALGLANLHNYLTKQQPDDGWHKAMTGK